MAWSSGNVLDIFDPKKPMPSFRLPFSRTVAAHVSEDEDTGPDPHQIDRVPRETGTDYVTDFLSRETEEYAELTDDNVHGMESLSIEDTKPEYDEEEVVRQYARYAVGFKQPLNLPIEGRKKDILNLIDTHPTVVISGFTGCGKSTQVPQYILDHGAQKRVHCNVVVVQPRRIAATSLAKRVCQERSWDLGGICGYQIGLEHRVSEDTRILFCTTGVFLEKLIGEKHMNQFTHIILDEVHERGQDLDMALILVRKFQQTNSRHVKVILMSATVESRKFSKYFVQHSKVKKRVAQMESAPEIIIQKSTSPSLPWYQTVEFYLDDLRDIGELPADALNEDKPALHSGTIRLINELILSFDHDDKNIKMLASVLVFLPGINEIHRVCTMLRRFSEERRKNWKLLPLHSTLPDKDQQQIFDPVDRTTRKIILATNIAESSITVPDVRYVIDFCLTKRLKTDPITNFTTLRLDWCAQSNCIQRAGRAGRVANGRVYRLVTRQFYEGLSTTHVPEIVDSPIEKVVLKSKKLGMGEPKAILALAMDPPLLENIELAVLTLKEVGGLLATTNGKVKKHDGDLTFLGRLMADLPVDIRVAKLIALGHVFNVLADCIVIGAAMTVKSPFSAPLGKQFEMYRHKFQWASGSFSDSMVLLKVYELWQEQKQKACNTRHVNPTLRFSNKHSHTDKWAQDNGLEPKTLHEIETLVTELTMRLSRLGIKAPEGQGKVEWKTTERDLLMKVAFAGACYPFYFVRSVYYGKADERIAVRNFEGHSPYNTVFFKGFDKNQPGYLYLPQIRAFFRCFEYLPNVTVNDEGTKFYVTFEERVGAKQFGMIHPDVYSAIKMRSCMNFTVKVCSIYQANEILAKAVQSCSRSTLTKLKMPEQEFMPPLHVNEIKIRIVYVEDPGCFYVHYEENSTRISMLEADLQKENNKLKCVTGPVIVGEFYLAPYRLSSSYDYDYYRAKIIQVENIRSIIHVKVFFVDYGNSARVQASELRYVPQKYVKMPCQAIRCRLAEIGPATLFTNTWSEKNITYFKEMCKNTDDYNQAKVYSAVDGVLSLVLYKSDSEVSFNEELIREGHAVRIEENYMSKFDCADRYDAALSKVPLPVHRHPPERFPKLQQQWMQIAPLEHHFENDFESKVKLDGPHTSLQMNLNSLNYSMLYKEISIESQSVNSVLLDSFPDDLRERLLVAFGVRQADRNKDNITLYNTTLMPNIHGLSSIVCMLFAPLIEFRINKRQTRYTGALCGLGVDEHGQPVYKDHDMEVTFDVEFIDWDIDVINRVRSTMSKMLRADHGLPILDCTNEDIISYHKDLFNLLFKNSTSPGLFTRERKLIVPERANAKAWSKFTADAHINSLKKCNKDDIFSPHCAYTLKADFQCNQDISRNLHSLEKMSKRSSRSSGVDCILCSQILQTGESVYLHLLTTAHAEAVREWQERAAREGCF